MKMRKAYGSFVGAIGVVVRINVESICWDFSLEIFLLNNILPELFWALCTGQAACHTNDGSISG